MAGWRLGFRLFRGIVSVRHTTVAAGQALQFNLEGARKPAANAFPRAGEGAAGGERTDRTQHR